MTHSELKPCVCARVRASLVQPWFSSFSSFVQEKKEERKTKIKTYNIWLPVLLSHLPISFSQIRRANPEGVLLCADWNGQGWVDVWIPHLAQDWWCLYLEPELIGGWVSLAMGILYQRIFEHQLNWRTWVLWPVNYHLVIKLMNEWIILVGACCQDFTQAEHFNTLLCCQQSNLVKLLKWTRRTTLKQSTAGHRDPNIVDIIYTN